MGKAYKSPTNSNSIGRIQELDRPGQARLTSGSELAYIVLKVREGDYSRHVMRLAPSGTDHIALINAFFSDRSWSLTGSRGSGSVFINIGFAFAGNLRMGKNGEVLFDTISAQDRWKEAAAQERTLEAIIRQFVPSARAHCIEGDSGQPPVPEPAGPAPKQAEPPRPPPVKEKEEPPANFEAPVNGKNPYGVYLNLLLRQKKIGSVSFENRTGLSRGYPHIATLGEHSPPMSLLRVLATKLELNREEITRLAELGGCWKEQVAELAGLARNGDGK